MLGVQDEEKQVKYFQRRIGRKINAIVGALVSLALVTLVVFYAKKQERSILAQNERTMRKVAESAMRGLETVMLSGEAEIAETFAARLQTVHEVEDFRVLRVDGEEAFKDNRTINAVNKFKGEEDFFPRETERPTRVMAEDNTALSRAVDEEEMVSIYEEDGNSEPMLTFLAPIFNREKCHRCHGDDHNVRGIMKLTTSLGPAREDIKSTWVQSLIVLTIALVVVMVLTSITIRRTVVRPIEEVTGAMQRASSGDLQQSVPIIGQDEISVMASSFNRMTDELLDTYTGLTNQQNKLTTIILGAREGMVITDSHDNVVLVNPAAEVLLGKTTQQIMERGLLQLFDEPEKMQAWLDPNHVDTGELIEYNERLLSVRVATIRAPDGNMIGSSCFIRDVTQEKRLEEELRALSNTDALTGLYNRRFLDATLAKEFERARRYGLPLSVVMFDVDHFKRFNDTYGHEMGDRVLTWLGSTIKGLLRACDVFCRFGGEEFVIILPNTHQDGAMVTADRLRAAIERGRVNGLRVTISMGVAGYLEHRPRTAESFLELADAALYAAKDGGRNQVKIASSESPPTKGS